jgi:VWFA-related protein
MLNGILARQIASPVLSSPRVSVTHFETVLNHLNPLRTFLLAAIILLASRAGAQSPPAQHPSAARNTFTPVSAADAVVHSGLFTIDVTVTDAAGHPVSNLAPSDFTLLDNNQPAKIRTLHDAQAPSEPAPQFIFVIDTVNLPPQQLTETESAISRFFHQNNGHLPFPCLLYRLATNGLTSSLRPLTDASLLEEELEQKRPLATVWNAGRNSEHLRLGSWVGRSDRNPLSLSALGSIAIAERDVPGHKVVVWIGSGWPILGRADSDFDELTELSTRLREARITLDSVTIWPNFESGAFDYHNFLEPPLSQKDMQPAKMSLPVIAIHSGGLVLDSSADLDEDLNRCAEEMRSFYTLTFNPPRTDTVDEYRNLRIRLARPALTARAPSGYYNEPVYFDSPRTAIEKVTVAQLEQLVHARTDLARKLENLELTERLSTPRLNTLLTMIHGERERQALTADADLSFALAPPTDEIVDRPPPPIHEQSAILSRAVDYLQNVIPKLPDFYALRNTIRFEEPLGSESRSWKLQHKDRTLHFATGEHATVLYRNGREVVEKKKKITKGRVIKGVRTPDLESSGTFGPILSYVLSAATARSSTLKWKRWEHSAEGDLAVFSYKAPDTTITPELVYCCLPQGAGTTPYKNNAADNGEFAINPVTGAIMRIVTKADLDEDRDPDVPLIQSQIMIEYGPEQLGDKTYICPQRSVEISRGRSERQLHEWDMAFSLYSYFETMINDVTFGGYHKFGSEARILPGFEETDTPTPPKKN